MTKEDELIFRDFLRSLIDNKYSADIFIKQFDDIYRKHNIDLNFELNSLRRNTPLMYVIYLEFEELALSFIDKGADIFHIDLIPTSPIKQVLHSNFNETLALKMLDINFDKIIEHFLFYLDNNHCNLFLDLISNDFEDLNVYKKFIYNTGQLTELNKKLKVIQELNRALQILKSNFSVSNGKELFGLYKIKYDNMNNILKNFELKQKLDTSFHFNDKKILKI